MSTLVPDSNNNCWFCDFHNPSNATACLRCRGLTIPTRKGQIKLEWTITSFDPHASRFNSIYASLFFASIKTLDDQDRAAIKVGIGLRQPHAHDQAVKDSLEEKEVPGKKKITGKEYPAVMIVKSPEGGKRFTLRESKEDEERQKHGIPKLETAKWNDSKDANQVFWDNVNQILDLDTHSPVRKICLDVVDQHIYCD